LPLLRPDHLTEVSRTILQGIGTPPHIATRVAEILVGANLAGHDSHGVIRIPGYLDQVEKKVIAVAAEPRVTRETPATAVLDAGRGWGHYAVDRAMALAIDKARAMGVGAVALSRINHAGRMGEYVEAAARAGCAGVLLAGQGGRDSGCAAPYGGRGRYLGSNPLAIGLPSGGEAPFLLDFATTVAARGKIQVALSKGESLPEGWVVDAQGRASIRPRDFFDGGSLLHFGGHKGYALSLATCLVGGLGGGFLAERAGLGGIFVQAVDVAAFLPRDVYERNVRAFLDGIRSAPRVDPVKEILVPGEPEARSRAARSQNGIDVPDNVWIDITDAASKRGIVLPPGVGAVVQRRS
jgi:hydroxycarboxylate dehydrogenase B